MNPGFSHVDNFGIKCQFVSIIFHTFATPSDFLLKMYKFNFVKYFLISFILKVVSSLQNSYYYNVGVKSPL
jgi:hypothetical protein